MFLRCNHCGQKISDRTASCPYCGYPVELQTRPEVSVSRKSSLILKIRYLVAFALVLVGLASILYAHFTEDGLEAVYAYDSYMKQQGGERPQSEADQLPEDSMEEISDVLMHPDPEEIKARIWNRRFTYYKIALICFLVAFCIVIYKATPAPEKNPEEDLEDEPEEVPASPSTWKKRF